MTWDIGRKCLFCHVSAAPQTRRHRQRWMRRSFAPRQRLSIQWRCGTPSAVPSRFFHLPHIAGSPFPSMASLCLPGELLISFHGQSSARSFTPRPRRQSSIEVYLRANWLDADFIHDPARQLTVYGLDHLIIRLIRRSIDTAMHLCYASAVRINIEGGLESEIRQRQSWTISIAAVIFRFNNSSYSDVQWLPLYTGSLSN